MQSILGYTTLTGLVEAVKMGIPNPLPKPFMDTTQQVIGDSGRYTVVTGQRQVSKIVRYGAPAQRAVMKDIATRDVKLLHTFEEQPMSPIVMQALRDYNNYTLQNMGIQEVSRQVKNFTQKFLNLRIATTLTTLGRGRLGWDSAGNLLPDSSYGSAHESHSFQIPANNQGQLNGLVSASWANNSTDIPGQLRALKQRALQDHGYELKYAFYGVNVPSHMTQNDYVLDYLARNPSMNTKFLESSHGEIPDGLFGFTWVPVYTGFFEDQNGTNQEIWGDDLVTFTPEVSSDWWEILEGSYPVPTTINIQTDAAAAIASMKLTHGMFSYGLVTHNPPTVTTYAGDTYLGVIKIPAVVYQATVANF